ncbi:MAG: alpha/beta hydrolase [Proteobacteria bacterium]|nr:alpha/beta hydrolase [Pseudomonadota bacterium]MCP4915729.1 alpha/beta hydrolase [Pseudomonadota bacterium]
MIVCLPGLLGDRRIFEPFRAVAWTRHDLHLLDLPPGAPREAAAALELPPGRHHLLTGSYGGLVARCLPPERIASIACVATLPHPSLCPPGIRRTTRLLRHTPAPLVEALYRRHQRRSLALDGVPDELTLRSLDKRTLVQRLDGVLAWDLPPPPLVPTLWLLGATDPQAAWSVADVLAHRPDVEVAHVPGGHRPYASHPGPLLTRLERFWALS